MSNLRKKPSDKLQVTQPVDTTFFGYSQIQLTIPRSVFNQAGIELNYSNVMKIVDEVLLPMPRFQGFRCDRRFWKDHKGNGRVILERMSMGDIVCLKLPEDFVLPPEIKELPSLDN